MVWRETIICSLVVVPQTQLWTEIYASRVHPVQSAVPERPKPYIAEDAAFALKACQALSAVTAHTPREQKQHMIT